MIDERVDVMEERGSVSVLVLVLLLLFCDVLCEESIGDVEVNGGDACECVRARGRWRRVGEAGDVGVGVLEVEVVGFSMDLCRRWSAEVEVEETSP